ncbi:hypothetical protein AB1Y20_021012 [Prymnesium parvum]|uniref:Vesicle transport v-SNARE N-terminal domain-containing protein n=1 Tax=Prymnesium parvum TaxID=97485 RepID=A0AB34JIF2_PRYPA|mmetsp:Transcript_40986/g.99363  ORF Transcript_40986/g.99363 Transcript_40986/m.99363 type:complete len:253 (-) Transcript_40986:287-1045(-)
MAGTRVFDHYEAEYLSSTKQAAQGLEYLADLIPGGEKDKVVKATASALDAADLLVQQMELEARSTSGETKAQLVAQAKDYKSGIALLRRKLRTAQSTTSTKSEAQARAELFASTDPSLRQEVETQHARLLQSTERLQKGTEKLRAARQTALETEAIGSSIMVDLEQQRQTMERSRATLAFANSGLDRSKKLLQGMGRRAQANKVLMVVIIVALLSMILLIIWLNFFFKPSHTTQKDGLSPPPPPPPMPPTLV